MLWEKRIQGAAAGESREGNGFLIRCEGGEGRKGRAKVGLLGLCCACLRSKGVSGVAGPQW